VTGFFTGQATFGSATLRGRDKEVLVLRLGPNGNIERASHGDGVSGDGADLIRCDQIESGRKPICVNQLVFDGSAHGFGGKTIDAFSVGGSGVLGDIGEGDELDPPEEDAKLFLPSISR
jgi:hypothetical protein